MGHSRIRKGGFTLIEIMVVIAIAAIISTITFGAFKSISEGNRRTNCQSNLSQIYQSCRLYAQDYENKFPYLNEGNATYGPATPQGGLGLWSLYTFPKVNTSNCSSANVDLPQPSEDPATSPSLAGYVRSNKIFHCPNDDHTQTIKYGSGCTTQDVLTPSFTFTVGSNTYLNPSYLSYQVNDEGTDTYTSFRRKDDSLAPVRQLIPYVENSGATSTPERPTRDMTIVTWCRFHRKLDSNTGLTIATGRNFDNVLFYDGSVQNLPTSQNVTENGGASGVCTGWNRVPRDKADTMKSAANCIPSS